MGAMTDKAFIDSSVDGGGGIFARGKTGMTFQTKRRANLPDQRFIFRAMHFVALATLSRQHRKMRRLSLAADYISMAVGAKFNLRFFEKLSVPRRVRVVTFNTIVWANGSMGERFFGAARLLIMTISTDCSRCNTGFKSDLPRRAGQRMTDGAIAGGKRGMGILRKKGSVGLRFN